MEFASSNSTSSSHEVAARRRALSNISKIVASLRTPRDVIPTSHGITPITPRFRGYHRTRSAGYDEATSNSNNNNSNNNNSTSTSTNSNSNCNSFLFPNTERRRFTRHHVEPLSTYEGIDIYNNWNNMPNSNAMLSDSNRRYMRRIRRNRRNRHGKRFSSFRGDYDINEETVSRDVQIPGPPPSMITLLDDQIEQQPVVQPLGALPIRSLNPSLTDNKSSNGQHSQYDNNVEECRETTVATSPPRESQPSMLQENDPASGASVGGYGTSSSACTDDIDNRTLICGSDCAEREDLLSLREQVTSQLRELRHLQEHNYMLLNASLQENFQATGALEGRFDAFLNRSGIKNGIRRGADGGADTYPMGHASTVLMWTLADTVSAIILWLITVVIAKPYDAVRRSFTFCLSDDDAGKYAHRNSNSNDSTSSNNSTNTNINSKNVNNNNSTNGHEGGERLKKRTSITRGSNNIDEGAYFFSRKSWRLDNSAEILFHGDINTSGGVPFHSNKQLRFEKQ